MVRRQISESQRWQIIGMHTTGMSFKAIGRQMGFHYAVVNRLVRKHTQTNNVKYLSRSGRPRVTSDRENRALQRLVRRMPFSTSPVLKQHWLPNRRLSTRTARNSLKSSELKSNLFHQIQLFVSDSVSPNTNVRFWYNVPPDTIARFWYSVPTDTIIRFWYSVPPDAIVRFWYSVSPDTIVRFWYSVSPDTIVRSTRYNYTFLIQCSTRYNCSLLIECVSPDTIGRF